MLLLLVCVAGCAVGPDYQRPEVQINEDWRWKTAAPADGAPRGAWWEAFNDPALNALQERAGAENLELKAAFARVEQARANARMSRSELMPSLDGGFNWSRYRTSGNSPSPVGFPVPSFTQEQWTVPFDLSYEIDLWGKVRRSFESARNLAYSAEAARQSVLLTLQGDVAATYLSLQAADKEVALLEDTIRLREEAFDAIRQRAEAGIGSEFEVQRGRTEVAVAKAGLQSALRARAQLFNALAVLCGAQPSIFKPEISPATTVAPEIAPNLPSSLLERRPDIAQAERQLAARMAEIGVAKAAFFPSIRLTTSGGYLSGEFQDLFEWDSHTWSIGPSVSLPIFAGGRNKANLERSRAAYEESVMIYRQQILVAFSEVEDNLAALQYLGEELSARNEAAESARRAASISYERYRSGAINFLELVDAESARLQNELAAVRTASEQQLATVRLIKALGGGWNTVSE
jgi:multidrug efflux system outer membrane protein